MGRHSAPDDAAVSTVERTGPVIAAPARHYRSDAPGVAAVADAPTVEQPAIKAPLAPDVTTTGPIDLQLPPEPPASADAPSAATSDTASNRHGTAADLALVRRDRSVRARVAAAVLVPFVVYAAVLAAIGASVRQGLLWIVVPLVIAGVLVGVFLDAAHKKHGAAAPASAPDPAPDPAPDDAPVTASDDAPDDPAAEPSAGH